MHEVRLPRLTAIWGIIFGISIVCSIALDQSAGPITPAAIAGPLPPPVMPPNEIKLTPVEQLGKFMLSNSWANLCSSITHCPIQRDMPALLATSPSPALRDQIPQSTFLRARSPGLCPGGSVIANRRVLSTRRFVPLAPSLTPV
jgi:hypothetical protein